jgi:hypothetical protein
MGNYAGKNFAYILGTYMSDACITKEYGWLVLRLEVMDEDYADAFYNALIQYGATNVKKYKIINKRYSQGYSFFVVTRDRVLIGKLVTDTNSKTKIPEYVYLWDKECKMSFISAMMDGEGYVSKRKKIMRNGLPSYQLGIKMDFELLKQFVKLIQSIGLRVGKYTITKPKHIVNIQTASVSINLISWVESGCYFNITRKQNRINDYISNINLNDYTPGIA